MNKHTGIESLLVLSYIRAFPNCYGYSIYKNCGSSLGGVYTIIRRLEKDGLITVIRNMNIRGKSSISITKAGELELDKIMGKITKIQVYNGRNLDLRERS